MSGHVPPMNVSLQVSQYSLRNYSNRAHNEMLAIVDVRLLWFNATFSDISAI